MRIVGTAGHVDHGKSSLIRALTGTNPDRLKEEQEREMTIELGFAELILPNGNPVGIVDVPGHLDFISNMLSGISGVDAVMLVIAADEGVAPQTREHTDILRLLDIKRGLVVITKIDLIDDAEWLDLVELDARELLSNSSLADAPIVRVSARSGAGLPELLACLQGVLSQTQSRRDLKRPRLPVDRVFSLPGFGTVVTGTLLDGSFHLGDEVLCLPSQKRARIRGLQNHKHKLQESLPGFRTAVNLSGIEKSELNRGEIITLPGQYHSSRLWDVRINLLEDTLPLIKHNMQVKVFHTASVSTAYLRLLNVEGLEANSGIFAQLKLDDALTGLAGDRFILRLPSPSLTLGGGVILNAQAEKLWRRSDPALLPTLENLASSSVLARLEQLLLAESLTTPETLSQKSGLPMSECQQLLEELQGNGLAMCLQDATMAEKSLWIHLQIWEEMKRRLLEAIAAFHQANPMKAGMPLQSLQSRLGLSSVAFSTALKRMEIDGTVLRQGAVVKRPDHRVQFSPQQEERIAPLLAEFEAQPYAPPELASCVERVGTDLVEGLIVTGRLVRVSEQILFSREAFETMRDWVIDFIQNTGNVSLAELRDHFGSSRKYATALLEYLDELGLTIRKGEGRILRRKAE